MFIIFIVVIVSLEACGINKNSSMGLYMMDFVTENTAYSFGFTSNIIAFKDGQYKIVNIKDDFDLIEYIFNTLNIKR